MLLIHDILLYIHTSINIFVKNIITHISLFVWLLCILFINILLLDFRLIVYGLLRACAFSIIEYTFTSLKKSLYYGYYIGGKTTILQFILNCVYLPLIEYFYASHIPHDYIIVLSPLLYWMVEIIQGYTLMYVYGYNTVWFYHTPDALFHNNIRLLYAPLWMMVGYIDIILPRY